MIVYKRPFENKKFVIIVIFFSNTISLIRFFWYHVKVFEENIEDIMKPLY